MKLISFIVSVFIFQMAHASPRILYFDVNTPQVDAELFLNGSSGGNTDLRFSFIVSDPTGLDKIAGAVLVDPVTQAPYGTFQSGTEKSAMQLDLTLEEISKVRQFDPFGPRERIFTAIVFNENGQSTSQDLSVEFSYFDRWMNSQPFSLPGYDINFQHSYNISTEQWTMNTHRVINGKVVKGRTTEFSIRLLYLYGPMPEDSRLSSSSPATFCKDVNNDLSNMGPLQEILLPELSYEDCDGAVRALDDLCTYIGGQVLSAVEETGSDGTQLVLKCSKKPAFAVFESSDGSIRDLRYLAQ